MKKTLSALLTVSLLTAPATLVSAVDAPATLSEPRRDVTPGIPDSARLLAAQGQEKDKDKGPDKDKQSRHREPDNEAPDRGDRGKSRSGQRDSNPPSTPPADPADGRESKANDSKPRGNDREKAEMKAKAEARAEAKAEAGVKLEDEDRRSRPGKADDDSKPRPEPSPTPEPAPQPEPTPTPTPMPEPAPKPEPAPRPMPEPAPKPEPSPTPEPMPAPTPGPEPAPGAKPSAEPQAKPDRAAETMKDRDRGNEKDRDDKSNDPRPKPKPTPETSAEKPDPRSAERPAMKPTGGRDNDAAERGAGKAPESSPERPQPTRPDAEPAPEEVARVLEDRGQRDPEQDAAQANRIDNRDEAARLIQSILGQADNRPAAQDRPHSDRRENHRHDRHGRLPVEQVGRTTSEREQTVDFLIRRFAGNASLSDAPPEFHSRRHNGDYDDRRRRPGGPVGRDAEPHRRHLAEHQHFHGPDRNRRVVYYSSRTEIPPVLLASVFLNRIQAQPLPQSAYRPDAGGGDPEFYRNIPENYQSEQAYAVSYPVDPNSAVSREDIIFQQGSTALADSYSYDLVVDLAEAMNAPALQNEKFVIEGHASAEGDYSGNLRLSQQRSERIARDLVDMGVNPDRLLPVGYGEAEAQYPADGAERLRSLDRRVVVFRMTDPGR